MDNRYASSVHINFLCLKLIIIYCTNSLFIAKPGLYFSFSRCVKWNSHHVVKHNVMSSLCIIALCGVPKGSSLSLQKSSIGLWAWQFPSVHSAQPIYGVCMLLSPSRLLSDSFNDHFSGSVSPEFLASSIVGIATGYGLEDRGIGVRVPVGSKFSLLRVVQTDFEAHPASYPIGTGGSFPWGKAAATWSWPLTSSN
jgi:hypothetical protein